MERLAQSVSSLEKPRRQSFAKYVLSEHRCPNCGEKGSLWAEYRVRAKGGWYGPYFSVKHTTWKYDPERHAELKKQLGKCPYCGQALVGRESTRTYKDSWRTCYFGRQYPKPILVPIPSPE